MANRAEQTYGGGSCRWGIQFLQSLCSWAASQFKQFSKLKKILVATSSLTGASRSPAAAMGILRRTSNKLWQISRYNTCHQSHHRYFSAPFVKMKLALSSKVSSSWSRVTIRSNAPHDNSVASRWLVAVGNLWGTAARCRLIGKPTRSTNTAWQYVDCYLHTHWHTIFKHKYRDKRTHKQTITKTQDVHE